MSQDVIHRFIPNSAPKTKQHMLDTIGVENVDKIYEELPENVRFKGTLNIPQEPVSEFEVAGYIKKMLKKNKSTDELVSFLGAGCWNHYVPAICDEINSRDEFVTAYAGVPYVDLGRHQAGYETVSMIGDLLEMDVVSATVYDGSTAAGDTIHMAYRYSGRKKALVPSTIGRDRLDTLRNYGSSRIEIVEVAADPLTGQMDIYDLKAKISQDTAAVLIENPTYLGFFEEKGQQIADIAHEAGALFIVVVEPLSLGVITPPSLYGADVAVIPSQPLGLHQNFGGSMCGFIACRDDSKLYNLIPNMLYSPVETVVPGELAFSERALYGRTFYKVREKAESFTGTSSALWGITNGVYLSLLGGYGLEQVAKTILYNVHYTKLLLDQIPGVSTERFKSSPFKEFVVDFNETGKTVEYINAELLKRGILGGKDLSCEFPALGQCALWCVTEVHSKQDIDNLATALKEVLA